MKVREVADLVLLKSCGGQTIQETCDQIVAGDPEMEVTGIVTTYMATVNVIKKAVETGANMIITHEPTWFTGSDAQEWCAKDSVYLAKKKLLEDNHIAVWRFHDHMHTCSGMDMIYAGVIKELGWEKYLLPDQIYPWVYEIPETTVSGLVEFFKEKLDMSSMQIIGNPDMNCSRIGILVGGGSLGLGREEMPMEVMEKNELDVLVCGDITEWTTCAYINDAYQLGMKKAMIKLGHEKSEEAGMKHLAPWLQELVGTDLKVTFVDAKEPFTYL